MGPNDLTLIWFPHLYSLGEDQKSLKTNGYRDTQACGAVSPEPSAEEAQVQTPAECSRAV